MENEFILAEMQSCQSPHPDPLFYTNGWDSPAFNPMVSLPSESSPPSVSNESVLIRELIEKLGGFGSNPTKILGSSCYSTPLRSPLKLENSVASGVNLNFAEFSADPGFVERAARLSCFGSRSFDGRTGPYIGGGVKFHQGHFPAATADREVKQGRDLESPEESSVIEPVPSCETGPRGYIEMNPRKRKGVSKTKEPDNASKVIQGATNDGDDRNKKESDCEGETESTQNKIESKAAEAPKDYIHVRARRGQATDSHSLAERVRREKISERMKVLQDLVPGCNKVTGKAVMLDEIINYVQSLQRQVEFMSMKLASINTIHSDSFLSKDHQVSLNQMFPGDSPARGLEDDLHTIVQMGLATTSFQHHC